MNITSGIAKEISWVATSLGIIVVFGWVFDFLGFALLLYLAYYILRNLYNMYRFEQWQENTESIERQPPQSGLWADISLIVSKKNRDLEKKVSSQNKQAEQYKTAFMRLEEGVVSLDKDGKIEWYNRSARKRLKLKLHDIGRKLEVLVRNPKFINYLKEGSYSEPLILPILQGVPRTVSISAGRYYKNRKLIIIKDIHDLYNLAQVRKDFIANASHELRTPLTVINGYVEVMLDGADELGKKWLKPLEQMNNQSKRMQSIISDLLTLSSLETENITEEITEVDVPKLLEIQQESSIQMASELHKFKFTVDKKLTIKGYTTSLTSIFSNLISNAIHYSPKGGLIEIKWYKTKKHIVFEVEDRGIGIGPEHITRVTERFYRVDAARSRKSGGTGLGLPIVKYALERHKAKLIVESQQGRGSRFVCEFP